MPRVPDKYANKLHLYQFLDNVSHDVVSNFLKRGRITPGQIWEQVKQQYSRAVGGLVRGIAVVSLVHTDDQEHYPIKQCCLIAVMPAWRRLTARHNVLSRA